MTTCPDCDGTGQDPDDGIALDCRRCQGLGDVDPWAEGEELARDAAEARWQDDRLDLAG